MNIGFFGVGNMGGPMAANLVKAGHTVTAFDLVPELLSTVEADGVAVAADPAAAVAGADVVISMLPSAGAVTGMYLGDHGVGFGMGEQAHQVDHAVFRHHLGAPARRIAVDQQAAFYLAGEPGVIGASQEGA